ncbi:hypothetical protein BM221_010188 [Beauveria bassiana]|uniref:Uncharacterized protein n=1 Tax=Beauveria bassiana TaxID=176275 RepID=A0A2N6N9S6_BEABA|nr:hypothetical protein BM221_010188 [Beauveria bassiana]
MPPTPLGEFTTTLSNDHESRAEMSPLLCQTLWLNAGPKEALYHGVEELQRTMARRGDGLHCVSSDYTPMVEGAATGSRWSWPVKHVDKKSTSTHSGYQRSEKLHHKKTAWKRYRSRVRPQLWHSRLYMRMQDKARRRDRCVAMGHAPHRTVDLGAFSDVGSQGTASQSLPEERQPEKYAVPAWLPERHQRVDNAKLLAQYMATSDYIVSLAGPPLPDIRYGVIIVPCGEEELLLKQPDQEVSYEDVKTAYSFTREDNGLLYEEIPNSILGCQSSMSSTEFRYYDRQRLLEEWEDDQRATPWVRPSCGSNWSETKSDSQEEGNPKLVDSAQFSQWSATHAPDYGSWVGQEFQSFDEEGRQVASVSTASNETHELERRESSKLVSDLNLAGSASENQAWGTSTVPEQLSQHASRAVISTAHVSNMHLTSFDSVVLKLVTDASTDSYPKPAPAKHDDAERPRNVPADPSCIQPLLVKGKSISERTLKDDGKGKKRYRAFFTGLFNALLRRKPSIEPRRRAGA